MQSNQISELQNDIIELQTKLEAMGVEINQNSRTRLMQNNPNPFNESTEISYSLTSEVKSACIMIFDMNGTNLKTYDIDVVSEGKLVISANELKPGMYIYSLIADGKEVGTRRMIITE